MKYLRARFEVAPACFVAEFARIWPGLAFPRRPHSGEFGYTAVLGILVVLFAGCGRSDLSDVSGTVTFRGAPVSHGIINFVGSDNQPHGGPISANGSYACEVPFGSYDVIISAPAQPPEGWHEGEPLPELKPGVPEKYGLRQTSGLKAVVSELQQTIDFPLEAESL